MIYKVSLKQNDLTTRRKIVRPRSFINNDFARSYKAWVKRKTWYNRFTKKEDIFEAVKKIFENVAISLVERDGGVVMEGIGYFAFYMPMKRRFNNVEINPKSIVRPHYETDYYSYLPYLFTDVFYQNKLKGWSMDYAFNKIVKRDFKHTHRHMKLYYKEVKNLYK